MSTDTKIKTLIFNKLTQEQYDNADKVPTEFYLTPDTSIDSSEKGVANGVATLDSNTKVPVAQIPDLSSTYATIANTVSDVVAGSTANKINVTKNGSTSTITINNVANATKASQVVTEPGSVNAARYVYFEDSSTTGRINYDSDFKYNPSTNVLTVGSITGNAATASRATADASGNTISTTYVKLSSLATVATSGMYSDLTGTPSAATANTLGLVKPDGNTITVTEDGTISAAVSGDNVATKSELQDRVAKAGDTMSGQLQMTVGSHGVRFNVDDTKFFSIESNPANGFTLLNQDLKGIYLDGGNNGMPVYTDGTNFYRLLTIADLETLQTQINSLNTEVTGMLGRMNFNARVDFSLNHGQTYTIPSKGYLWINYIGGKSNGGTAYINGGTLANGVGTNYALSAVRVFVPVSAGDVLSASRYDNQSTVSVIGFFVPQI